jgi:hypothetical protein
VNHVTTKAAILISVQNFVSLLVKTENPDLRMGLEHQAFLKGHAFGVL